MGLFQAVLLAASLGWTIVVAEPYDSASANTTTSIPWTVSHTGIEPTLRTKIPELEQPASSLETPQYIQSGSMTVESPVTVYTEPSLDTPSTRTDDPPWRSPVTQITASSLQKPVHESSPTAQPGHQGKPGGSWPDAGSDGSLTTGAAEETYYIDGSPVVAGASPTVIAGTTYSLAATGGKVWVDGTVTSAKGLVSTPAPQASSNYVPVLATGAAHPLRVSGVVVGLAGGVFGGLVGAL